MAGIGRLESIGRMRQSMASSRLDDHPGPPQSCGQDAMPQILSPPPWSKCAGFHPELAEWRPQPWMIMMERRKLGGLDVSALALGCMSKMAIYGVPVPEEAIATLHRSSNC
jgi:hypothetical protein